MHIVDSTLFFAPHSGGVKRYLLAKHAFLAQRAGIRHSLLVPGSCDAEVAPGIFEFASPRLPFGGGYRLPLRLTAWKKKLIALAPDVIEVGDPYHLAWTALDAAAVLQVPIVAFTHSNLSGMLGGRFGHAAGALGTRYLRSLYQRFDLILAPSQAIAAHLRASGIERVMVQPLGVDDQAFHPRHADTTLRRELGLEGATRLLIFAGRMGREKRIDWLQRTIESLGAPYHLLLVGGERLDRSHPRITRLPYQHESADLARLLASSDALIHAGEQETFGMVFLEAMACARPVIGMRCGAVCELVDASVGRVVEQNDVAGLRGAVIDLFQDDLALLGANARRRVEQRYSWDRVFAQQLETYARLHARLSIESLCVDTQARLA
jgi:alpha-1,6-mannosyltransferase